MESEGSGPSGRQGLFEQFCLGAKTSFDPTPQVDAEPGPPPLVNDVGTKSKTVKGRGAGGTGQTMGGRLAPEVRVPPGRVRARTLCLACRRGVIINLFVARVRPSPAWVSGGAWPFLGGALSSCP